MSLVLDHIDVNISSLERVYTSASIDRILILFDLNDTVEFVWTILVASKIIKIEPISFTTLASHNAYACDAPTRELTWKYLQW